MVLKEPFFNSFYSWDGVVVLKELIFLQFLPLGGCGGLERTHFNSFYLGRVWWS